MTAEREAMTLERQAFVKWYGNNLALWGYPREVFWQCWQAAIANLSRAAEPVAWCDPDDPMNSTAFAWPGTERDPARHTDALFTHPPEPARDAKDAARYRLLADHEDADLYMENPGKEQLDRAIDAAMQANPDAKESE